MESRGWPITTPHIPAAYPAVTLFMTDVAEKEEEEGPDKSTDDDGDGMEPATLSAMVPSSQFVITLILS